MKKSIFYVFALALVLMVSIYNIARDEPFGRQVSPSKENSGSSIKKDTADEFLIGKQDVEISKATLAAVGDVLIHDRVYNVAYVGNDRYDFMPMLSPVESYLRKADITVANQETMIGGVKIGLSTYPSFNSPHEVGDALKKSGVDVVTLANNHTLDRGEPAIQSAIAHWNKIGMLYTGAYASKEDKMKVRTIERKGIVFSFLAYTYGTNGIAVPPTKPYLVNVINRGRITQDIVTAKEQSDVVVVSFHFGKEYERWPNDAQKELVRETAQAGADIIIGHHPHVLQPMEWIQRKDGKRTLAAYSLGNFLSGQRGGYKGIGGIMQINVEKREEDGKVTTELKNPVFVPTFVGDKYVVYPLEHAAGKEAAYEETKKHMNQWMPELKFSFP